jgi:hypothetical protein
LPSSTVGESMMIVGRSSSFLIVPVVLTECGRVGRVHGLSH